MRDRRLETTDLITYHENQKYCTVHSERTPYLSAWPATSRGQDGDVVGTGMSATTLSGDMNNGSYTYCVRHLVACPGCCAYVAIPHVIEYPDRCARKIQCWSSPGEAWGTSARFTSSSWALPSFLPRWPLGVSSAPSPPSPFAAPGPAPPSPLSRPSSAQPLPLVSL